MIRVLDGFAWCLVAAAVFVLVKALFFEASISIALTSAAVPAGVLLALAGHFFTQARVLTEGEEKRSKFNLDGCVKALTHAHSVLANGNNDRAAWIEAGRSVAHAEVLAKSVTIDEHKRVLEVERLGFRGMFHALLADRPATFFYGVPPCSSLDEAAKTSSQEEEQSGRIIASSVRYIDEAAIRMVWRAASWPKDYVDPAGPEFANEELGSVMLLFPELHRFLEHRRTWVTAAGKLYRRGTNEDS